MALKIEPLTIDRLGEVRRLFEMMSVEHLNTVPYPVIDEEEIDNFCVALMRQLHNPYAGNWVAIRGHKCVGFVCCEIQTRAVGKPNTFAAVHWIYSHPRHRERGVARRLLAAATDWGRSLGITHGEWCAIPGDQQWEDRGVPCAGMKYAIPTKDVVDLFTSPKIAKIG